MSDKMDIVLDNVDGICEKFELEGLHTNPTYKQFKRLFGELKELRAVLAQEAGKAEAVYQVEYLGDGGGGWSDVEYREFKAYQGKRDFRTRTVYTSPPAPVAVVLPERLSWSGIASWKQRAEITAWNACLDKVKELNQ